MFPKRLASPRKQRMNVYTLYFPNRAMMSRLSSFYDQYDHRMALLIPFAVERDEPGKNVRIALYVLGRFDGKNTIRGSVEDQMKTSDDDPL